MRKRVLISWLAVAASAAGIVAAPPALAAATDCTTPIVSQTILGNVNVPPAATCQLRDVVITGNLTVQPGGTLFMEDSELKGSLTATRADVVVIRALVRGTTVLSQPIAFEGAGPFSVGLCGNDFRGSLTVRQPSRALRIAIGGPECVGIGGGNTIVSNVSVLSTSATEIVIGDNTIGGNLVCSGNSVAPVLNNNTVTGNVVDQCVPIIIP